MSFIPLDMSFYHLVSLPLAKALPRLLEKVYASKARVIVFCDDEEILKELDDALWTYGQRDFLPHGTFRENHPEQQPIYLTLGAENPNQATILVRTGYKEHPNTSSFTKIIDMFEDSDPLGVQYARDRYKKYKELGHNLTYWKQDDAGKWAKLG